MLLSGFIVISSILIGGNSVNCQERLTEEMFYKADTLLYTPSFCSSLKASDFIQAILPKTQFPINSIDSKSKAFKTLFDACRDRLLFDATMAKNVIIPMIDTGNTKYLPLLLDQGMIKRPKTLNPSNKKEMDEVYNNLDLSPEIKSIVLHLFGVNLFPTPSTIHFFFQVRKPDLALALLLAYTSVQREEMEEVRDLLENIKTHVGVGEYSDARAVDRAAKLLDHYLKYPKSIGDHNLINLKSTDKTDNTDEDDDQPIPNNFSFSSSLLSGFGMILGCVGMAGILFILWKHQNSSKDIPYHPQTQN